MTSPILSRMVADLVGGAGGVGTTHQLPATPDSCFWGYVDAGQEPVLTIESGDVVEIETITHHAGDAPDLLMDDGVRAIWDGIPQQQRGPGVHVLTGPIYVNGAQPGDTLVVQIQDLAPRLPYGSNCAANWGLLYHKMGKERITIYELIDAPDGTFGSVAKPKFAFDFMARQLYDMPGVISEPGLTPREPFSVDVRVPVRPHFGVLGVAPDTHERLSSIPPGRFGGNVDDWRFGMGATICYPVLAEGALLYAGDPHFAQGDGEICGTAIEASLNGRIRVSVAKDISVTSPLLETPQAWVTHGFGDTLDEAMRMAAEQALWVLVSRFGFTTDDAYSLCSVAVDFGVTQVVDGTVGCHAIIAKSIFS
jgi:acetamidase/formamidase